MGHDTTHIHPLITSTIAKLIRGVDKGAGKDNAYSEIYKLLPEPTNIATIPKEDQLLYWGTDFDPLDITADLTDRYIKLTFSGYVPLKRNVVTGVVYEDNPFYKVRNHFYQANTGIPLTFTCFLNYPCLALKQAELFHKIESRFSI